MSLYLSLLNIVVFSEKISKFKISSKRLNMKVHYNKYIILFSVFFCLLTKVSGAATTTEVKEQPRQQNNPSCINGFSVGILLVLATFAYRLRKKII